jgi:hypothetical protein
VITSFVSGGATSAFHAVNDPNPRMSTPSIPVFSTSGA